MRDMLKECVVSLKSILRRTHWPDYQWPKAVIHFIPCETRVLKDMS